MERSLFIPREILPISAVGPHIPDTGFIKAIKLTNIAGLIGKEMKKINSLPGFMG